MTHYRRGPKPNKMTAEHNIKSFAVLEAALEAYGGHITHEHAVACVQRHSQPGGGEGFVSYLVKRGYLEPRAKK
jgi:hypothetical protein